MGASTGRSPGCSVCTQGMSRICFPLLGKVMASPAYGYCRICGIYGRLSFEHCPPAKAFNEDPIVLANVEKLRAGYHPDNYDLDGRKQQRGAGAYTLCERCNNNTGSWYGPAYVKFAKQGMEYLQSSRSAGVFTLPLRIMPLRVVKQVICMIMSVNGPKFQRTQRDLVRFVLNKGLRHLPNHVRLFAFYSIGDRSRSAGVSELLKGYGSAFSTGYVFSEITFPPFGFVLIFNCAAPDDRLTDISHFADDFGYEDERTVWIRLPVLPVYTFYPGDYRNRDKVLKDAGKNLTDMSSGGQTSRLAGR